MADKEPSSSSGDIGSSLITGFGAIFSLIALIAHTLWEWPHKTLVGFGAPEKPLSILRYMVALFLLILFVPGLTVRVAALILIFSPIWLPIILARVFWSNWISYVREKFLAGQEYSLIEVKVPREIEKSPRAMELVFAGIHNVSSGEATFINRWIEGKVRPWWSFEIVSIGGQVHYYVWMRKGLREYTETQIYAEFPGVEIYEVQDYAVQFHYDPNRYSIWGCNFKLGQKDAYPIKSYVDYELDKDPKEEYKVDPLSHLLEYMSSLKPGEQAWIQIIIRSNKDKRPKVLDKKTKKTAMFAKEDRWKKESEEEIADIKKNATNESGFTSLTPSDELKIKAIARHLEKSGFDTGIRGIYVADQDSFKATRIAGITGVFKQFGSSHLNSIVPDAYMTIFNYPWQKWFNAEQRMRNALMDAYRKRAWFFLDENPTKTFVMTTEELATIYHFPSRTIQAPGIERIGAQKAEPPANLPIE